MAAKGNGLLSSRTIVRLLLASLLSGALAGLLMMIGIEAAELLDSLRQGAGPGGVSPDWLDMAGLGLILGLLFASWPAFFAGSVMWVLAVHRPAAWRPAAWAAAGSAAGAASWALVELIDSPRGGDGIDLAFLAVCLLCGALSALAFRLVLRFRPGLSEGANGIG